MDYFMEEITKKEKKKFTILGFDLWEILAYFIIYSGNAVNFICHGSVYPSLLLLNI